MNRYQQNPTLDYYLVRTVNLQSPKEVLDPCTFLVI